MVEIRPMGPQIGVEVTGVDVKTLDDAGFAPIYQAWLDHNILVVTGQELTIPEFLRYSRRFGHVTPHPSKSTRHPEHPDITISARIQLRTGSAYHTPPPALSSARSWRARP